MRSVCPHFTKAWAKTVTLRVGTLRLNIVGQMVKTIGFPRWRPIWFAARSPWSPYLPAPLAHWRLSVKELIALQPDLIFTHTTPSTAALLQQTHTIPIVFATLADPVGSGLVKSLARPGGNATGFIIMEPTTAGKWLELLLEIAPRVNRVAFLFNPATARYADIYLRPLKAAAASVAVEALAAPVHDRSEFESVFAAQAREPNGGLIVMPDSFVNVYRAEIVSLAARYHLPSVYPWRSFAELGGLLSYGSEQGDMFRLAATYVLKRR
jgi:putative ABC transport system substrate-binding protein